MCGLPTEDPASASSVPRRAPVFFRTHSASFYLTFSHGLWNAALAVRWAASLYLCSLCVNPSAWAGAERAVKGGTKVIFIENVAAQTSLNPARSWWETQQISVRLAVSLMMKSGSNVHIHTFKICIHRKYTEMRTWTWGTVVLNTHNHCLLFPAAPPFFSIIHVCCIIFVLLPEPEFIPPACSFCPPPTWCESLSSNLGSAPPALSASHLLFFIFRLNSPENWRMQHVKIHSQKCWKYWWNWS